MILTDGALEMMKTSGLTMIQEKYGIKYEEFFDEDSMRKKDISKEDLEYVLANRDTEFSRKDKPSWILTKGLFNTKKWKELKEHFGLLEEDCRDIKKLESKGLTDMDIFAITGIKPVEIKPVEIKNNKKKNEGKSKKSGDTEGDSTVADVSGDTEEGVELSGIGNI